MNSLTVDDLRLEVRRSARRKSVQITVERGGELLLSAPEECSTRVMERFVRQKRFWIYTKLAEKDALGSASSARKYVNGEGFLYLGRSYRLLIVAEQEKPVKLEQGRFKLSRAAVASGARDHMISWYAKRAQPWLAQRVERYRRRVGVEPTEVSVQDLGYRWGSCGKAGRLHFHWRTILLAPRLVEYVVVHELVHMIEPHHTPAFWSRLERAMPDFAARKLLLAEQGSIVAQL